jgi:ATP-dependent Clp protease ATP-binding subunit ClpA
MVTLPICVLIPTKAERYSSGVPTVLSPLALDVAAQSLRPELVARISERIVFRPLDFETQKMILYKLIRQKLEVLPIFFGRALGIDGGPATAFLLRVGYSKAFGARMLRQEVDRQFNSASLPWALSGRTPQRGVFRHDPAGGCLVLE